MGSAVLLKELDLKSKDLPYYSTLKEKESNHPRAIVCGWQDSTLVTQQFQDISYSLLGNLYSRYGAEVLLSNISHLPYIKQLVVSGNAGYISDLLEGRVEPKNISPNDVKSIVGTIDVVSSPCEVRDLPNRTHRFSVKFTEVESRPSEEVGFVLRGSTLEGLWNLLVEHVSRFGVDRVNRYGRWKELHSVSAILESLDWFIPPEYEAYIRGFKEGDVTTSSYTYYSRIHDYFSLDQLSIIKKKLSKDGDTRCTISLWDSRLDNTINDHPPCLVNLSFSKTRGNGLFTAAFFRSHDVYRAWKYNVYAISSELRDICKFLELEFKGLCIFSQSAQIYRENYKEASKVKGHFGFIQDKRGNFVVERDRTIKHFDTKGNLVQIFRPRSLQEARRMIAPYISRPDHAMYIGEVLTRVFLLKEDSKVDV